MVFSAYIALATLAVFLSAVGCWLPALLCLAAGLLLVFAPEFRALLGMLRAARMRRTTLGQRY